MLTIATIIEVMRQGQDRPHFHAGGPYVPLMRAPTKEQLLASTAPVVIVEGELVEEIVVTSRTS